MSETADGATPSQSAWQPFTFGGVAAFARSGPARLFVAQLAAAILAGCSAVYFLHRDWSPVVIQAIQGMPETARIVDGRLLGMHEAVIAETKFFAIAVTPDASDQIGQSADVQVQFRPSNFRVGSVFRPDWGWEADYGREFSLMLSRAALEPWWGAWQPVILACIGVSVLLLLFGIWALLASIYTLPAKLITWFTDRDLSWRGAWRLGSAALLPGALLMALAIMLYAWQALDLIELGSLCVAHLLMGWVYVVGAAWVCPRSVIVPATPNPFNT